MDVDISSKISDAAGDILTITVTALYGTLNYNLPFLNYIFSTKWCIKKIEEKRDEIKQNWY